MHDDSQQCSVHDFHSPPPSTDPRSFVSSYSTRNVPGSTTDWRFYGCFDRTVLKDLCSTMNSVLFLWIFVCSMFVLHTLYSILYVVPCTVCSKHVVPQTICSRYVLRQCYRVCGTMDCMFCLCCTTDYIAAYRPGVLFPL